MLNRIDLIIKVYPLCSTSLASAHLEISSLIMVFDDNAISCQTIFMNKLLLSFDLSDAVFLLIPELMG